MRLTRLVRGRQGPEVRDDRLQIAIAQVAEVRVRHDREHGSAVARDAGRDRTRDFSVAPRADAAGGDVPREEVAREAHLAREVLAPVTERPGLGRAGVAAPVALGVAIHANRDVVREVGAPRQKLGRRLHFQIAGGGRLGKRGEQVAHTPQGQNHDGADDDQNPFHDCFHAA
jgi:hypothetical protein